MTASDTIRVELTVEAPGECPVAEASAETGAPVTDLSRTAVAGAERVTEEFTLPADAGAADAPVTPVGSDDARTVYRFTRSSRDCVCERVERVAGPVSTVRARDGRLHVGFRARDLETVRAVVDELRDGFDGVRVRQLHRSGDAGETDPVVVDRGQLTERQREVLRTALELGYFAYPKGANAGEVAGELGVSQSTFAEHLAAAQAKLTEAVL